MLIGIASGTYSSIFIASPVLTAWKEREPGFARRRERIAEIDGTVPAYADEVAMARLADDSESDAEIEEKVAVAVAEPVSGDGGDPTTGDGGQPPPGAGPDPESAERRERNAKRRERRQKRRKHGRNR
jgi:SecD/SecF fusion protein